MKQKKNIPFIIMMGWLMLTGNTGYSRGLLFVTDTSVTRDIIQFVFCSDLHFGLVKNDFQGEKNVSAATVNAAMTHQINILPDIVLPNDSGVNANKRIKFIDAVVITGDIANREENGVQSAAASWSEFCNAWLFPLHLKTSCNHPTPLLLTPGNHDISNAIGYRKPMQPARDVSSVMGMYNLMMHPVPEKNKENFRPATDKIHNSVNIGNIHFVFIDLWPDSAERIWMEKDISTISDSMPVFLFTHSMPDVEARFFINPNGKHDINDQDKFENLLSENFKDGDSVNMIAIKEQRGFAAFVKRHPNIKAYFHGHSNYTEFYDWKGPDNDVVLHCFRVDSPMKGKYSSKDETKLSYELISVDTKKQLLTVREFLWNHNPANHLNPGAWGSSITLSLR